MASVARRTGSCRGGRVELAPVSRPAPRRGHPRNWPEFRLASPQTESALEGAARPRLVEGGVVVDQPGGNKNKSVAAFPRGTGKRVWRVADDLPCYAAPSPSPCQVGGMSFVRRRARCSASIPPKEPSCGSTPGETRPT